jgi:CHC2 zinc finger
VSAAARSATGRNRIEEAKARFTIPVLWRMFNLPGKPARSCRSPFREDRSPSFSISEDGRRWIDFATGERGDAVDFLAKIKSISSAEAFIELLKVVDGTVQGLAPTRSPEVKTEARRRTTRPGPKLEQPELFPSEPPPRGYRGGKRPRR